MKTLNDYFKDYDDSIRLKQSDYNIIREKRDTVLKEFKEDESMMSFKDINLGSYRLFTGVKYKDNNYDIDCGILLNIKEKELENYDAKKCKNMVFNAIHEVREKTYKNKCITVEYFKKDSPIFHVDFPVFAYDEEKNKYYLAEGKQHENVLWKESHPDKVIDYLNLDNSDYKRIVRLLKKWNNKAFANERKDVMAPGIGLTVEAREWFSNNKYEDDLSTIIAIMDNLKKISLNGSIYKMIKSDISTDNIYYKMNSDSENVYKFNEIVSGHLDLLKEAKEKYSDSIYEAYRLIKKVFPEFPEPEKESARESFSSNARYA